MLQKFNQMIQGWVASVIIGIIAVCFVLWGVENYLIGANHDNMLAKVGNTPITLQDFQPYFLQTQQKLQDEQGKVLSSEELDQLKKVVLDKMINDVALNDYINQQGLGLSHFARDTLLAADPKFQDNGQFSADLLKQVAFSNQVSVSDYLKWYSNQAIQTQLLMGLYGSDFVLPNELKKAYLIQNQTRDIQYTILSAGALVSDQKPTDAQIQAYYDQHQKEFVIPEKVKVNYVVLSAATLEKNIVVGESEAKAYYQDQNAQFIKDNKLIPFADVKEKIMAQLKKQKAEDQYATLRNQMSDKLYANSDSLESAAALIKQPVLTSDWLVKGKPGSGIFADAQVLKNAFTADVVESKLNSEPIELSHKTLVALHVNQYQASTEEPLLKVKPDIIRALQQQMATQQLLLQAKNTLTALQDKKPVTQTLAWQEKKGLTRQSGKQLPSELLAAAFQLSPQNLYQTVSMPNGDVAIVKLLAVHEPDPKTMTAKEQETLSQALLEAEALVNQQFFTEAVLLGTKIKRY